MSYVVRYKLNDLIKKKWHSNFFKLVVIGLLAIRRVFKSVYPTEQFSSLLNCKRITFRPVYCVKLDF